MTVALGPLSQYWSVGSNDASCVFFDEQKHRKCMYTVINKFPKRRISVLIEAVNDFRKAISRKVPTQELLRKNVRWRLFWWQLLWCTLMTITLMTSANSSKKCHGNEEARKHEYWWTLRRSHTIKEEPTNFWTVQPSPPQAPGLTNRKSIIISMRSYQDSDVACTEHKEESGSETSER